MAWLNNWQYRKKITIQGQSGAGIDYQVLLEVGESSGASGCDFHVEGHSENFPSDKNQSGDLRFTKSDGTTLLNFWVEKVEGANPDRIAYCWVKIEDSLDNNIDIYCYYGNPDANNVSDGDNTFDFFDDFEGNNLDTNKWTVGSGTWTVENSNVHCQGDKDYIHTINDVIDKDKDWCIEYKSKAATLNDTYFLCNSSGSGQMFRLEARSGYPSGFANTSSWTSWGTPSGLPKVDANTYYKVKIEIDGSDATGTIGGIGSTSISLNRNGGYIGFQTDGAETSPGDWWDYIFIRKYVSPEPSFSSTSNEEQEGLVYNIDLFTQKLINKNYNLDLFTQKLINKSSNVDILLQIFKNYSYDIDIVLGPLFYYNVNVLLKKLQNKNYNINLLLQSLKVKNYNTSLLLQKLINKSYNIDSLSQELNLSTLFALDLLIQQLNVSFDYLINVLLQTINSHSYNLEISLFDTNYVFFDGMILQLVWNDEFNNSEIDAIKRLTLAQNYNIQEFNICEKPITLEATENQGWLTRKQVEMLYEKASVPNKIYPLIYNGKHYLVRFRWEDPPVIDVTPILPRPNMADDDYYYGTIKLMQILR